MVIGALEGAADCAGCHTAVTIHEDSVGGRPGKLLVGFAEIAEQGFHLGRAEVARADAHPHLAAAAAAQEQLVEQV